MNGFLLALLSGALAAPPAAVPEARSPSRRPDREPPNILVVVADDFGIDAAACFDTFDVERAPQPRLKQLCRNGVVFDRTWSDPFCSPTRAHMLTGRHGFRTLVGEPVGGTSPGLPLEELILPAALDALGTGHAHAAIGKWHLADDDNGGDDNPNLAGFAHYSGALPGQLTDYEDWVKIVDGEGEAVTNYATSEAVDDAIAWLDDQEDPWFLWLAFNAPHYPVHLPPDDLHSYDLEPYEDGDDPVPYFLASIEAMDTELGRLLDHLDRDTLDNTWIIFVGDNGTEAEVNQGAYLEARGKGTLWQGGIHVPMVVVGPGVEAPGRREDALVGTIDVFSTVIELAGGHPADLGVELDSVSLLPYLKDPSAADQRRWLLSEVFGPKTGGSVAGRAITDGRYKYIRKLDGTEYLFDLQRDPTESINLAGRGGLEPAAAKAALEARLDSMPLDEWWDDDTGR